MRELSPDYHPGTPASGSEVGEYYPAGEEGEVIELQQPDNHQQNNRPAQNRPATEPAVVCLFS